MNSAIAATRDGKAEAMGMPGTRRDTDAEAIVPVPASDLAPRHALGIALLLLAGVLELLLPWPIKWLVDYVFGGRPAPPMLSRLGFAVDAPRSVVWRRQSRTRAHKAAQMISQFLLIRAGLRLVRYLRTHVSDHLHRLSLRYHDRTKVGDSIYRAAYDSYAAQSLLSGVVAPVATGVVILVGILVVMVRPHAAAHRHRAAVAPARSVDLGVQRIEHQSRRYHEQESALFSTMQETLNAIRFVRAYNREADTSVRRRPG